MKKLTLLVLLNSFMYSQECHEPSGWCYDISTFQCFYMFETLTLNDEPLNWVAGECYDDAIEPGAPCSNGSDCPYECEDLNGDGDFDDWVDGSQECSYDWNDGCLYYDEDTRDVVGAFCDGTMVGWTFVANEFTIVPAMGNDGLNNFCNFSATPTFELFDYSSNLFFSVHIDGETPLWMNNEIHFIQGNTNISSEPDCNGDIGGNAIIDDCGNCVGGNTGMEENWAFDECGVCYGGNYSCSGCTNSCATNYDPEAIIDDGSCVIEGATPTVYYNLFNINNLIGYTASPAAAISDAIPQDFQNKIDQIIGGGVAAVQISPGTWVGSLDTLRYGYGYWVKVNEDVPDFNFE